MSGWFRSPLLTTIVNSIEDTWVLIEDRRDHLVLGVVLVGNLQIGELKVRLGLSILPGTQVGPPFAYLAGIVYHTQLITRNKGPGFVHCRETCFVFRVLALPPHV